MGKSKGLEGNGREKKGITGWNSYRKEKGNGMEGNG